MKKALGTSLVIACFVLIAACAHDISRVNALSAKEYFEKAKYDDAIAMAKQSVANDPSNGAGWYWLGAAYFETKKYTEAVSALKTAIKVLPDTAPWVFTIGNSYYYLGYSYLMMGNYDEAIQNAGRALERNPQHAAAFQLRGMGYANRREYDEAIRDFNKALQLAPFDVGSLHWRGRANYYQGNFDAAKRDFDSAIQHISPNDKAGLRDNLVGKAFAYLGLGDSGTALTLVNKAKEVSEYQEYSHYLALIHYLAGDKEKAWHYRGGKGRIGVHVKASTKAGVKGAVVEKNEAGGPAEKAGVLPGDVIIGLNGNVIEEAGDFVRKAVALNPGTTVIIKVLREGTERELHVQVGSAGDQMDSDPLIAPIVAKRRGKPEAVASRASVETSLPEIRSDVDDIPAAKAKTRKNAYAVVIGIESYRQKLPSANYATQDAQRVAEYLIKVLGYPEENVITLLNEHATNVDLAKYFEKWLPNNVENGGSVFIYYSGHGAPNPKTGDAYLVPYDGDPSFIDQTGYSLKRMYDALGKLPARDIVVALDSCFSGAGGRSVLAEGARPLVMNLKTAAILPKNMIVLSAAQGDQISSTYQDKGHGLFTYFLLKGIKNEEVVKPDGTLEITDLYGYIKPQVESIARKKYNNEQSPQLFESRKN